MNIIDVNRVVDQFHYLGKVYTCRIISMSPFGVTRIGPDELEKALSDNFEATGTESEKNKCWCSNYAPADLLMNATDAEIVNYLNSK